jgi:NADH-quinone oxidoreductase subunit G
VDAAVKAAAELLAMSPGAVAVVGSGRSSVEEQFLSKRLAAALQASTYVVTRTGEGDGILISADRNPNLRGALVTGLISQLPQTGTAGAQGKENRAVMGPSPFRTGGLEPLAAAIDAGRIKAVVSVGEDLAAAGLTSAQLARVSVIYLGTHQNATTAAARIIIPTCMVFEKSGTFVNQQFRIQKFFKCVPGPVGAADDLVVLSKLLAAVGGPAVPGELHALWQVMAAEVGALNAITFASLPETGLLLDSTPFTALSFGEGETLHYKPASATAAAPAAAIA